MRKYLKASGLIAFLDGVGTDTEFKSLIVHLANEAVDAMKERGRVAPIYFTEDAGKFTVEPRMFKGSATPSSRDRQRNICEYSDP